MSLNKKTSVVFFLKKIASYAYKIYSTTCQTEHLKIAPPQRRRWALSTGSIPSFLTESPPARSHLLLQHLLLLHPSLQSFSSAFWYLCSMVRNSTLTLAWGWGLFLSLAVSFGAWLSHPCTAHPTPTPPRLLWPREGGSVSSLPLRDTMTLLPSCKSLLLSFCHLFSHHHPDLPLASLSLTIFFSTPARAMNSGTLIPRWTTHPECWLPSFPPSPSHKSDFGITSPGPTEVSSISNHHPPFLSIFPCSLSSLVVWLPSPSNLDSRTQNFNHSFDNTLKQGSWIYFTMYNQQWNKKIIIRHIFLTLVHPSINL